MINVTKSYLPPIEEYIKYLEQIWESGWLTNNGVLVRELEEKIKTYLGVKHFFFLGNGTIALQLAIKALDLKGEIITTPFSYVATTTAILWENCKPIFVDISPIDCCIDVEKIESAITENTSAILATHVYGNPCNVEKIETIAQKYDLKVIYDGAHAFGVQYKQKSVFQFGDISTLSFHATKLLHTIEGGGVTTENDALAKKLKLYRSFGHVHDDHFTIGVNGKNSEFHAAMGLCNIGRIPEFIEVRKQICLKYDEYLKDLPVIRPLPISPTFYNYAYYPVIFENEEVVLQVFNTLLENDIKPRRYFYPSLNKLPYLKESTACPISESYANRVLCLPLYQELSLDNVYRIGQIIKNTVK